MTEQRKAVEMQTMLDAALAYLRGLGTPDVAYSLDMDVREDGRVQIVLTNCRTQKEQRLRFRKEGDDWVPEPLYSYGNNVTATNTNLPESPDSSRGEP